MNFLENPNIKARFHTRGDTDMKYLTVFIASNESDFRNVSTIKFHEIANNVIQILPRRRREKQILHLIKQVFEIFHKYQILCISDQ